MPDVWGPAPWFHRELSACPACLTQAAPGPVPHTPTKDACWGSRESSPRAALWPSLSSFLARVRSPRAFAPEYHVSSQPAVSFPDLAAASLPSLPKIVSQLRSPCTPVSPGHHRHRHPTCMFPSALSPAPLSPALGRSCRGQGPPPSPARTRVGPAEQASHQPALVCSPGSGQAQAASSGAPELCGALAHLLVRGWVVPPLGPHCRPPRSSKVERGVWGHLADAAPQPPPARVPCPIQGRWARCHPALVPARAGTASGLSPGSTTPVLGL